jgi:hypothetical protein
MDGGQSNRIFDKNRISFGNEVAIEQLQRLRTGAPYKDMQRPCFLLTTESKPQMHQALARPEFLQALRGEHM